MPMRLDVSVIIVNYNTRDITRNCLQSVFEQTQGITFEVIVSDNGSTDGSQEMIRAEFPEVVLIENGENIGFGAANNRALDVARGEFILYLNSDTYLLNNAVKLFFDYWMEHENESLGCLGCILRDRDLSETHSGGAFPTYKSICEWEWRKLKVHCVKTICKILSRRKLYDKLRKVKKNIYNNIGRIDYVTGADLFLKNNTLARFDENFFLYFEETDLQLRMFQNGLLSYLIPAPKIVHFYKKKDDDFIISSISDVYSQISAIKYAEKNLIKKKAYFLRLLIAIDWLNPYIRKIKQNICQ